MQRTSFCAITILIMLLAGCFEEPSNESITTTPSIFQSYVPIGESLPGDVRNFTSVDYTTGTIVEFDWSSFDKNFGGNCCEHYLATTKEGWILNFGGEYPTWSEDRGNSWNVYMPSTLTDPSCRTPKPTISGQEGLGEGSIVQTINGDLISMGWFPYPSNSGGDQFYAFLYDEESASGHGAITDSLSHSMIAHGKLKSSGRFLQLSEVENMRVWLSQIFGIRARIVGDKSALMDSTTIISNSQTETLTSRQ